MTANAETAADELALSAARVARTGLLFGIMAALSYSLTNILLRNAAGPTDLGWNSWATCLKAVPSALAAWCLIGLRWSRGERGLDGWRSFVWLSLNGLFMQFGGNIAFQYSLSYGGLALSVPLCFAALILAGALGGRLILKERLTTRTLVAMSLLILSVLILQMGAGEAANRMRGQATTSDLVLAVVLAVASGLGYGFGGVSIRRAVTGTGTIASTIAPLSSIGVVGPGMLAIDQMGIEGLQAVPVFQHAVLLMAGFFNACGFFFVSAAMARLPLVRVNLINASQIAMCALGGVMIYGEPATAAVGFGTLLTMASLAILGTRESPRRIPEVMEINEAELAGELSPSIVTASAAMVSVVNEEPVELVPETSQEPEANPESGDSSVRPASDS